MSGLEPKGDAALHSCHPRRGLSVSSLNGFTCTTAGTTQNPSVCRKTLAKESASPASAVRSGRSPTGRLRKRSLKAWMKSNERVERVNGLEIPSTVLVIIFCIGKGTPILAWLGGRSAAWLTGCLPNGARYAGELCWHTSCT